MKKQIFILVLWGILGVSEQAKAWSSPISIESSMSGTNANPVCMGVDGASGNLFFAYGGRPGLGEGLGVNTFSVATGLAGTSQSVGSSFSDNALDCSTDSDGNFYVSHSRLGNYDIYYVMYNAGAWGSDTTVDSSTTNVNYSAVAVDSSGNLHIVYTEGDSSNKALFYATGAPGDPMSSWTLNTIEFGGTVNLGVNPAIAIDSSDAVHVAYFDGTNNDLKYASKVSTATVFTVQSDPVDSDANYNANLDMAIDSEDGVHISYLNSDELKHALYADGVWTVEDVDTTSSVYHDTSITAVSPTSVHITYWDNSTGKLKYATNVTGEWVSSDVATTDGYISDIVSGISGDEGSVYISYYNSVSDAIELVYNTCGNTTVDVSEECDGDTGCGANCEYNCGNGSVDSTEECDDGNSDNTDSCLDSCESATCGDGKVWNTDGGTEACDDGNVAAVDGCSATCTEETGYDCTGAPSTCITTCGDGIVAGTEVCDDGNVTDGDGCSMACAEESGYDCTGATSVCATICGDNVVAGTEICDDGNTSNTDMCLASCEHASCGDGHVNTLASEVCDDGNTSDTDMCLSSCQHASCGDGYINALASEVCDDGNTSNTDTCLDTCQPASCGDGYLNTYTAEACDDGNTTKGDGCSSACVKEYAPVVYAGANQTVVKSKMALLFPLVYLKGTVTDQDNDVIAYKWTFTSVPTGSTRTNANISNSTTLTSASFRPDKAGTYTLSLKVTDFAGNSATATVVITASTAP